MNSSSYCRGCGRPLEADTRFCEGCGIPVVAPVAPSPAAMSSQQTIQSPHNHQYQSSNTLPAAQAKPKRKFSISSVFVALLGLILVFFGLRYPLLDIIGTQTNAYVTNVRQIIDSSNSQMDHTYRISYTFTSKDGKTINSSYNKPRAFNLSKVPREGSNLRISYLPALPLINVPAGQDQTVLGSLLLTALGGLIFVLAVSGKITFERKRK